LTSVTDRLPATAAAHPEGRLVWNPPHAGAGQAAPRAIPARLDERGLWRPTRAPAEGELLGPRQSDWSPWRLRRGQALRRSAGHGLPPPAGRRYLNRADLQYVRPEDATPRRPRDPDVPAAGPTGPADHRVRRRLPDPLVLLRRGRDPRLDRARRVRLPLPGQHRQPRRVHIARAREDRDRGDG